MSAVARFVDANVFVYAYFRREHYSAEEKLLSEAAEKIIGRIDAGEKVCTSAVHLSEAANVLGVCYSPVDVAEIISSICGSSNVGVLAVERGDYLMAAEESRQLGIKLNDCLAFVLMRREGLEEIYSFDKHFDSFDNIRRFTK